MAEKSRLEFILEIVKTLTWPAIVAVLLLWLGGDVREILKSRTWKIGIIEVGEKITTLEDNLQSELLNQKDYLNKILENSANPSKVEEYVREALTSIENAKKGVKKEIRDIQETIPQELTSESSKRPPAGELTKADQRRPDTAREWETLGFKFLLERKIEPAIEHFTQAEKIRPDYHNVAEIRSLLLKNRQTLLDEKSPKWKELYQKIIGEFSWGMPTTFRREMEQYIKSQPG